MKASFFTWLVLTFLIASSLQTRAHSVNNKLIVSPTWLADHLHDPDLVLLQVGEKEEYLSGHIPGAQFITVAEISTPRGEGLTLELPPLVQLKAAFEKFGIRDNSRIVVYFSKDWVSPTARVFLTLDYLGLGERTSILDGGLPAWKSEGKPITSEIIAAKPGNLTPRPRKELIVDGSWVNGNLNKAGVKILDARAPQFYSGAEMGRMPRGGHIPKAKNIPFSTLVDEETNKFKSAAALRQLFEDADVQKGDSVTTYCHIGQTASLLYFVARYLGYDAHLYDGSFEDWSRRSELSVQKSVPQNTETKP
jgi:thiosulfate/3-mercaptopyruvate sulfurtransferase